MGQRTRAWVLLALTLTIHLCLARLGARRPSASAFASAPSDLSHTLLKRSSPLFPFNTSDTSSLPAPSLTFLDLPFAHWYSSAPLASKPFVLAALLFLLAFLFSFIGITASDFFCPNLSTIAVTLGLSESTAGVTFLAFGNGSPDVFSTFSAVQGGTFGLAVGELLGAASFITSIVVGSIAMIRPFHVPRHAFIRDITFFTAAVIVLVATLYDGRLTLIESTAMIALYAAYVAVVVFTTWWNSTHPHRHHHHSHLNHASHHVQSQSRRASKSSQLAASIHGSTTFPSNPLSPETLSLDAPHSLTPSRQSRPPSHRGSTSRSHPPHLDPDDVLTHPHIHHHHSHSHSHSHPADTPRAAFSLLGAVEFRDVVNSLRKEGVAVSTPSSSRSPSPTPGGSGRPSPARQVSDYFGVSLARARRATSVSRHRSLSSQPRPGHSRTTLRDIGFRHQRKPSGLSEMAASETEGESEVASDARLYASEVLVPAVHEPNPWQDQTGNPPTPSPLFSAQSPPSSSSRPSRPQVVIPSPDDATLPPPAISVIDPSGGHHAPTPSPPASPHPTSPSRVSHFRRSLRTTLAVLFPSLQSFRHKSYLGMVLAVLSAPAVLALTLTLPVVDDGRGGSEEGAIALPIGSEEPLVDSAPDEAIEDEEPAESSGSSSDSLEEGDNLLSAGIGEELHHLVDGGFSPLHSPLGRIHHQHSSRQVESPLTYVAKHDDNDPERGLVGVGAEEGVMTPDGESVGGGEGEALEFYPALTAAQCILGPIFCTFVIFGETDYALWILLAAGIAGLCLALVVLRYATDGRGQPWRLIRCFAGFICSMVWISAIADQVVGLLDTVGEIFGLSDAIIGLTIFALGNSLADLVANVTVAQFAPAMAYAACFGGPMLNLLLGIGGSGTYSILTSSTSSSKLPEHAVTLDFSPTLAVSSAGVVLVLVATAIAVPMNGYLIDRKWAVFLIAAYIVLMVVNIVVELRTGRS